MCLQYLLTQAHKVNCVTLVYAFPSLACICMYDIKVQNQTLFSYISIFLNKLSKKALL